MNLRARIVRMTPVWVIVAASLIVWRISILDPTGFVIMGDTTFPVTSESSIALLSQRYFLWNTDSLGFPNLSGDFSIPYFLFITGFSQIGVPLEFLNRMVFIAPMIVAGLSTYHFSSTFIHGNHQRLVCTIAGLFAVVTPAQIFQNPILAAGFAFSPLMMSFFIRGFEMQDKRLRYAILAGLTSVLVAMSPFALVLSTFVLIVFFANYLAKKRSPDLVRYGILVSSLVFLANFYWIYPFLYMSQQVDVLESIYSQQSQLSGFGLLESYAEQSSLLYMPRLFINAGNGLSNYFDHVSPVITAFSVMLPVFAYLALINRQRYTKILAGISIVLTIFATGLHYPSFADVYTWMWENIVPLKVLNTPYYFLAMLSFLYAVMIAATTQKMIELASRWGERIKMLLKDYRIPVTAISLAIVMINGGMTLNFLGKDYTIMAAIQPLDVPASYFDLQNRLRLEPEDTRMLLLPFQGYVEYRWYAGSGYSIGSGILPMIHDIPMIGLNPDINNIGIYNSRPVKSLIEDLRDGNMSSAVRTMNSLGIKYVLVSKDLLTNTWGANHTQYPSDYFPYLMIMDRSPETFVPVMKTREFNLYRINLQPQSMISIAGPETRQGLVRVFDGPVCTCVTVPASSSLVSQNSGSIFASFWLNPPPNNGTLTDQSIVKFGSGNSWQMLVDGESRKLGIRTLEGNTLLSDFVVEYRTWYYAGFTFGSSNLKLYVDGKEIMSVPYSGGSLDGSPFFIGHDGTESFFNGYIINAQIYNVELSSYQVNVLREEGIDSSLIEVDWTPEPVINKSELVGWWLMDHQFTGDTFTRIIVDRSGHRNTGTLVGNLETLEITNNLTAPTVLQGSPTEYKISIENRNASSIVLNNRFDRNWKAYAENGEIAEHAVVGGYANSWDIGGIGSSEYRLVYEPQNMVVPSFMVSIISMLVVFAQYRYKLFQPIVSHMPKILTG